MAKRKRLGPAEHLAAAPETKSMMAPPIARVSAEAAAASALTELTDMVRGARAEGRFLETLPLATIDTGYLIRDRMEMDAEELDALKASIKARGQTTPVEVTKLEDGRYGLISGARRMEALKALGAETVLARIITPEGAEAAYQAMVEENEIRVNLTPYERAHIVVRAMEAEIFETEREALQTLYGNVSRSKRSKIGAFVRVVRELKDHLRFPRDLSERQGLALARVLQSNPLGGSRLRAALGRAESAEDEAQALNGALDRLSAPEKAPEASQGPRPSPARSYSVSHRPEAGEVVISGDLVDGDLIPALKRFLAKQAQK